MLIWLQKYWQKVLISLAILTGLYLISLTVTGWQIYKGGQKLLNQISATEEVKQSSTNNLNASISRAFTLLKLPIVKQVSQIAGLDFYQIEDEIKTLISASPTLLGDTGPKQYLVAFQNTAEARGTGGILGAYAIVEFKSGKLSIIKTGSNAGLQSNKEIPIKMSDEFMRLYGKNPAIWQNSNLSPHFPYGAQIWKATWEKQFGGNLDGVIAIDPTAISYILNATGEVVLEDGEVINSENVVDKTLAQAYKKYEKDNDARKEHLVKIMNATFGKLLAGDFNKVAMAKALKRATLENRLLLYSTTQSVQSEIEKVKIGGALDLAKNNQFRVVIQNIDASKLDYYLDRSISIQSISCTNPKQTQVIATVTNKVVNAKELPAYVLTRADKGKPANLITGQHRFKIFIYGPVDAKLESASRSTPGVELGGGAVERKRPVYVTDVDLAPNQSETVLANFSGGVGKITYVDQPLVRKTQISIKDKCGA